MPRIEPPVSDVSEPFWEATKEERYLIQWCTACDTAIFYPREVCPGCLGSDLEWRPASGRGEVYAVSVQHRGMLGQDPYPVVLVDLPEGIRVMSNVVGVDDPYDVKVGMPVAMTWEPLGDGRKLPLFTPAG